MRDASRELQAWLSSSVRGRHGALAASTAGPEAFATAVVGADDDADFEIGSVSKAITGLLFTESVTTGVVRPETPLGELLAVGDGPIASVPLSDLATHRSGLPRLPAGMHATRRTWEFMRHGVNPYGDSLDDLLMQASATNVGRRRFRYSNLGFELLGHAVASAHDVGFGDLLRRRLTDPLGMPGTYAPYGGRDLRPSALPGHSRRGRTRDPWTGEALAPAGGMRATNVDMATLLRALIEGTAPGIGALDPVVRVAGPASIGAAWLTVPRAGRTLTWHNGQTGGFASWIGLDRERRTGAVLLSATGRSVDRLGTDLLDWWDDRAAKW